MKGVEKNDLLVNVFMYLMIKMGLKVLGFIVVIFFYWNLLLNVLYINGYSRGVIRCNVFVRSYVIYWILVLCKVYVIYRKCICKKFCLFWKVNMLF